MNWKITTTYFYENEILDFTITTIDLSFFVILAGLIVFIMFWKIWK